MAEKFDKRVIPAINELRQAIAAIERAKAKDYPPHVYACMISAIRHAQTAAQHIERATP